MRYRTRISTYIGLVIILVLSFVSGIWTDTQELSSSSPSSPSSTSSVSHNNNKEGRGKKRQHHKQQRAKNHHHNNHGGGGGGVRRHGKLKFNWTESLPFPPTSDSFWRKEIDVVDPPLVEVESQHASGSSKDQGHETTTTSKKNKEPTTKKTPVNDDRPNIILVITDDQDIELGSMNYMPETLKVFRDEGIEFRHGYVTTPMCCPSRSSLLTGLYVHNHQVYTNNDNCSSIAWRSKYEKKTFAHYLHSSGFHTSYMGKYLNKYDGSHVPSGWSEWNALLMNSRFYNYTVNKNGRKVRYGNNYETDYYPDVITNETLDFLDRMSTRDGPRKPFLLVVSYPSPHGPEDSAPQYSNLFMNATPHHTPSYNYAPNFDKQWILRLTDKMTPQLKNFTNLLMTKRLQTLQSVDEAIKQMFIKLEETGLINSTYVFYTSDHGYHVGQFGLVKGKSMPYEFDIRVPFYLSPPKGLFNASAFVPEPVLNIDLAPTFLELANVTVPAHMDGRSLVPLINKYMKRAENLESWSHTFIIESSGRREVPNETKLAPTKRQQQVNNDNSSDRLSSICSQHPYPCLENQKKYCRQDKKKKKFRLKKCRLGLDYQEQQDIFGFGLENVKSWNFTKCRCSRDVGVDVNVNFDWEEEREKIDTEIDELKLRISGLRERRKNMRIQWIEGLKGRGGGRGKQFSGIWTGSEDQSNNNSSLTSFKTDSRKSSTSSSSDLDSHDDDDEDEDGDHDEDDEGDEDDEAKVPKFFQNNSEEESDEGDEDEHTGDKSYQSKSVQHNFSPSNSNNNNKNSTNNNNRIRKVNAKIATSERNQSQEGGGRSHRRGFKNRPSGGGRNRKLNVNNYPHSIEDFERERNCDCSGGFQGDPRILRMMEKEDRKRRKLKSKIRKKERFLNRFEDPEERVQAETCGHEEKMNCFWHDNDHWKTPPLWNGGSFCFCPSSNNNTFSCLRSINATHDYLYCYFMTGFKMFFDLQKDPQELHNLIGSLPADQEDWMLAQLFRIKKCQGRRACWSEDYIETTESESQIESTDFPEDSIQPTIWEQIFGRWNGNKKKKGRKRQN